MNRLDVLRDSGSQSGIRTPIAWLTAKRPAVERTENTTYYIKLCAFI